MMKKFILWSLSALLFPAAVCAQKQTVDNSTVKSLDLARYLGQWYEIARFDHKFERGLQRAKAVYTLREDGKVDVLNSGYKGTAQKVSKGKAKLTDNPACLRVSFFGPFYSDYRVMMLDENYQYALVGSSGPNYLWILSRTPQLAEEVKNALVAEARRRGYDTSALIWVEQP